MHNDEEREREKRSYTEITLFGFVRVQRKKRSKSERALQLDEWVCSRDFCIYIYYLPLMHHWISANMLKLFIENVERCFRKSDRGRRIKKKSFMKVKKSLYLLTWKLKMKNQQWKIKISIVIIIINIKQTSRKLIPKPKCTQIKKGKEKQEKDLIKSCIEAQWLE